MASPISINMCTHLHALYIIIMARHRTSLIPAYPYGYKGHQLLRAHRGEPGYEASIEQDVVSCSPSQGQEGIVAVFPESLVL